MIYRLKIRKKKKQWGEREEDEMYKELRLHNHDEKRGNLIIV